MPTDYGSGIFLSSQDDELPLWDMEVTNSGDIRTVSGVEELQKDVALSTTIRIQESLGGPITPIVKNRIRARVRDALEDEERIDTVLSISLNELDAPDSIEIIANVNAEQEDDIELVFEVTN